MLPQNQQSEVQPQQVVAAAEYTSRVCAPKSAAKSVCTSSNASIVSKPASEPSACKSDLGSPFAVPGMVVFERSSPVRAGVPRRSDEALCTPKDNVAVASQRY